MAVQVPPGTSGEDVLKLKGQGVKHVNQSRCGVRPKCSLACIRPYSSLMCYVVIAVLCLHVRCVFGSASI